MRGHCGLVVLCLVLVAQVRVLAFETKTEHATMREAYAIAGTLFRLNNLCGASQGPLV